MMHTAIDVAGVGKKYPYFELKDIEFRLDHGCVMGFIGPNGAGKSTTIRILMGLIHQDRGVVRVLGHAMPAEQTIAKQDMGFVSEDMRLYGHASIGWHMDFIKSIYPTWDSAYADELVRRFGLTPEQKIKGLSHGQRVKVALLLVLARRPRLMILDEPTTGLDPVARREVLAELMRVVENEERSILFSSHNTQDVEQIADQITFIDRGQIIDSRDKETFLDNWRRVRLEVPDGITVPSLPGIVHEEQDGHLAVLTINSYSPDMATSFQQAGTTVRDVTPMTLEEIFISSVASNRTEVPT